MLWRRQKSAIFWFGSLTLMWFVFIFHLAFARNHTSFSRFRSTASLTLTLSQRAREIDAIEAQRPLSFFPYCCLLPIACCLLHLITLFARASSSTGIV